MASAAIMAGLIGFVLDSQYARNLGLHGEIISINWKSTYHNQPEYRVQNSTGKYVNISDHSISLDKSNIKISDLIEKKRGDNFSFINGKK